LAAGLRESERAELGEEVRSWLASHGIEQADHVAIDRWTGGAADGRLYSVLEPHAVRWNPITIAVDLTRLGDAARSEFFTDGADESGAPDPPHDVTADAGLALLLLVLRDLAEGWIPLGHGAYRGLGWIEVQGVHVTGDKWPDGVELADLLDSAEADRLTEQWLRYAKGVS
jgi:hypothetical protein